MNYEAEAYCENQHQSQQQSSQVAATQSNLDGGINRLSVFGGLSLNGCKTITMSNMKDGSTNSNGDNKNLDTNLIKIEIESNQLTPSEQYDPNTIISNSSFQPPNSSPISSLDSDSKGTCLST